MLTIMAIVIFGILVVISASIAGFFLKLTIPHHADFVDISATKLWRCMIAASITSALFAYLIAVTGDWLVNEYVDPNIGSVFVPFVTTVPGFKMPQELLSVGGALEASGLIVPIFTATVSGVLLIWHTMLKADATNWKGKKISDASWNAVWISITTGWIAGLLRNHQAIALRWQQDPFTSLAHPGTALDLGIILVGYTFVVLASLVATAALLNLD